MTSLRVGGQAARRSCLPGLRRGGGGRQAGATVLSCLVWRCELALSRVVLLGLISVDERVACVFCFLAKGPYAHCPCS